MNIKQATFIGTLGLASISPLFGQNKKIAETKKQAIIETITQTPEEKYKEIINTPADSLNLDTLQKYSLKHINHIRDSLGNLHPLVLNKDLSKCAQAYAEYIVKNNRFSHQDKEKNTPKTRIEKFGFIGKKAPETIEENLARGQDTISSVFKGRLNESPAHRALILSDLHKDSYEDGFIYETGIGYYKKVWVQLFFKGNYPRLGK